MPNLKMTQGLCIFSCGISFRKPESSVVNNSEKQTGKYIHVYMLRLHVTKLEFAYVQSGEKWPVKLIETWFFCQQFWTIVWNF